LIDEKKSKERGASMINSIQQFQTEGVKKLEKVFCSYASDLTKVAEMVQGVTDSVIELGLSMIAEEWESYDTLLHDRKDLRPGWQVIRRDEVTKLTSLGEVKYKKTYFRNPQTGDRCYLLDRLMGFAAGERLTEDAVARIYEEAADSSYRKGGMNASMSGVPVSKETVMEKLHSLRFPEMEQLEEKKQVKTLYIDADEDHVALQYLEKKGDTRGAVKHTFMPKLVYVYEGIQAEGDRHELQGVKYFGGGYEGTQGTEQLWKEVYDYISGSYEEEVLERIYVNGDGAEWIRTGAKVHAKAKFVLDRYHMHKYILAATSHLGDSAQDARSEIWRAVNGKRKKAAEESFDRIIDVTETEGRKKAVETSKNYILGHWPAIMNGVRNRKDEIHCSAEGHVSHIYADRMSSRPLGWSKTGADKMARLRVYKKNGGDVLSLVRYQRQGLPKASGMEEVICSAEEVLKSERKNRRAQGIYADMPSYTIPYTQIRKIAALKDHIRGL